MTTEEEQLFEILGVLDAARRKAQEAYAQAQAGHRRLMWREILACEIKTDEALWRLNRMVDPDPRRPDPETMAEEAEEVDDGFVTCARGTLARMFEEA